MERNRLIHAPNMRVIPKSTSNWLVKKNVKQRTKLYYMEQIHTYLHYFST